MAFIEKRRGRYRARYRDPLGRQKCKTFDRKADAQRFLMEMEVDKARGQWIDPRGADQPLEARTAEFFGLARRLSPLTQDTYRRDLTRFVLPRFGDVRIGRLPPDEIENWLDDEIAAGIAPSSVHRHYRTLRRVLQVAVEKQRLLTNPCDRVQPPHVPKREMVFLTWEQAVGLAEAHSERFRALIYLAVDSGMRWSELVGLRRARLDVRRRKVRVTEQLIRLEDGRWLRKEPKTPNSVRSITISPVTAELGDPFPIRLWSRRPDASAIASFGLDIPAAQRLGVQVELLAHRPQAALLHAASFPPLPQQAHRPLPERIRIHVRSCHGAPSFLHGMEWSAGVSVESRNWNVMLLS